MGRITRRRMIQGIGGAAAAALWHGVRPAAGDDLTPFRLKYIVASCMYGKAPLAEILPEVRKCGAEHIELWAEPHGNQREQIDDVGEAAFLDLLRQHGVKLGSFTCFKHGILNMRGEMEVVQRLGGDMVICNSGGPKGLTGDMLRPAVLKFADDLRPHVDFAAGLGITIGLENHSGGLISSPDSQLMLLDLIPSEHFGIALAPAHLPQDAAAIARLIEQLGNRLVHIQAWGFGRGFVNVQLPPDEQLMQLPHRGTFDWTPILAALKNMGYAGRTEVFMHPTPRGIPIRDTLEEVTAEINRAREYLDDCLRRT